LFHYSVVIKEAKENDMRSVFMNFTSKSTKFPISSQIPNFNNFIQKYVRYDHNRDISSNSRIEMYSWIACKIPIMSQILSACQYISITINELNELNELNEFNELIESRKTES
jgi:hypothetical protein